MQVKKKNPKKIQDPRPNKINLILSLANKKSGCIVSKCKKIQLYRGKHAENIHYQRSLAA